MGEPLAAIMAAIADVQQAITPPLGQRGIQLATDEPPDNLDVFPTFANYETTTDVKRLRTFGTLALNELEHYIDMALIFAPADGKYSVRERRPWVPAVLDAFRVNPSLNDTCDGAYVETVDHRAAHFGGMEYPGLTFRLHVIAST